MGLAAAVLTPFFLLTQKWGWAGASVAVWLFSGYVLLSHGTWANPGKTSTRALRDRRKG